MTTQFTHCAKCDVPIDESPDTKPENREPCPRCGAVTRAFQVVISDSVTLHESVRHKHKDSKGKTLAEGFAGDDLHLKKGKWVKKERIIDKKNDHYKEVVTDPETGEVIHHCEEPLSKHQGHGSARKNP